MKERMKSLAGKAMGGDKEAGLMVVLSAPPGRFKPGKDKPDEYAKKVHDLDGEFPSDEPSAYDERIMAIAEVLEDAGVPEDVAQDAAEALCEAVKAGRIPGLAEDGDSLSDAPAPTEDEESDVEDDDLDPFDDEEE